MNFRFLFNTLLNVSKSLKLSEAGPSLIMADSDRTYVGRRPGPEWITVYYVTLQLMWELK